MNHTEAVTLAIKMFKGTWPSFSPPKELVDFWEYSLSQYPVSAIQAAMERVLITPGAFPPPLGNFRAIVVELAEPEIANNNATLAWERVRKWCSAPKGEEGYDLTGSERGALSACGGSFHVSHSTDQIGVRMAFLDAYKEYERQNLQRAMNTPRLNAYEDRMVKALPAPKPRLELAPPAEEEPITYEEAQKLLGLGYKADMLDEAVAKGK